MAEQLMAVKPVGTMALIHLHLPGYVPPTSGKAPKPRRGAEQRTLCALYVRSFADTAPLADALDWPGNRIAPGLPEWRWCGPCVGRALVADARVLGAAVAMLARGDDNPGEPS